jgi:hypothetical protein
VSAENWCAVVTERLGTQDDLIGVDGGHWSVSSSRLVRKIGSAVFLKFGGDAIM